MTSWTWWYIPVIPGLGRLRQEDTSWIPDLVTQEIWDQQDSENLFQKNKQKNDKNDPKL
jgi:hypothetical protein